MQLFLGQGLGTRPTWRESDFVDVRRDFVYRRITANWV